MAFSLAAVAAWGAVATARAPRRIDAPKDDPRITAFAQRLLTLDDVATAASLQQSPDLVVPALVPVLQDAGRNLRNAGDFSSALRAFRQAQRVAERLGDPALLAEARSEVGYHLLDCSEFVAAEADLRLGLALFESLGDVAGQARVLTHIGRSFKERGRFDEALRLYEQALELGDAITDDFVKARALFSIGNVHKDRGDYASALQMYERSLALVPPSRRNPSATLFNIGVIHDFQGDLDLALDFYRQALGHDRAAGQLVEQAYDLYGVGSALVRKGEWEEGRRAIAEAIEVLERAGAQAQRVDVENELARMLLGVGRAADAAAHATRALSLAEAIGNDYGALDALVRSAEVALALDDPATARRLAERAVTIAERVGSLLGSQEAYAVQGDTLVALGQRSGARRAYGAAIDASLRQREYLAGGATEQQHFFEQRLKPFHGLLGVLVEEGRLEEAVDVAEKARARVLTEMVRSGHVPFTSRMTDAERVEEQALEDALATLNARASGAAGAALRDDISKARLRLDAFRSRVYAAHPEMRLGRQAGVIPFERVKALAADADALIAAYVVTERVTYLFTLAADPRTAQKTTLRVHRIDIGQRELESRVTGFRLALASRDVSALDEARTLGELLLSPAHAELAGRKRLVILPDGKLWELPFQALRLRDGRYLLDQAAIVYAPSLTALDALRERPRGSAAGRAELLALGNATPPRSVSAALPPLPQAERQARALGALFAPEQRTILVGAAASESAAKRELGRHRLIHIAAHGFVDNVSPMYSGLALASSAGEEEDGRLEAREVINLRLEADLTVLSACETGRGRVASGEGMIGLSWAFLIAGSANVLVSQWRVDADSTEQLMLDFYRRGASAGMRGSVPLDLAEALRAATLALRRKPAYRHPFYWAAFRLVGSGSIPQETMPRMP
jgi:CHAT domain-containing protein